MKRIYSFPSDDIMRLLLIAVFSWLIVNISAAKYSYDTNSQWIDCCESASSVKIFYFEVSPNPIVKGSECHIRFVATTDVEIKGGNVTMLIRYGYDIIHIKKTFNLCDTLASNNLNCPLKPNMVALGIQASIPFKIPTGTYRGKISVTDPYGKELVCIALNLNVDL